MRYLLLLVLCAPLALANPNPDGTQDGQPSITQQFRDAARDRRYDEYWRLRPYTTRADRLLIIQDARERIYQRHAAEAARLHLLFWTGD